MTRKKHTKKKISPEHLAKLQAGRKAAQTHKKRVASAADLEARASSVVNLLTSRDFLTLILPFKNVRTCFRTFLFYVE